ncbi:PD-(D/E)XK nuclease family protein [Candidatus Woesearchaeota archaeon]|nr:PD-(D/E)XK nuclease family protein [Candidatus Woesearchaeota archaeon]
MVAAAEPNDINLFVFAATIPKIPQEVRSDIVDFLVKLLCKSCFGRTAQPTTVGLCLPKKVSLDTGHARATYLNTNNDFLPLTAKMEGLGKKEESVATVETDAAAASAMISVTDLTSYMYCPRLLFQQKVLGYEEKLNPAMVLGGIRHKFYDLTNKYEEALVVHLPETSREIILEAYSKSYQNLLRHVVASHSNSLALFDIAPEEVVAKLQPIAAAEAGERAENVYSFAAKSSVFGKELWQMLSPKILSELKVKSPMLRLKGTVDRVEIHPNTILPIELKTGKMPSDGVWPSHRVQAAAYMMLLQEKFNTAVTKAVVRYLDHNSSKTVVLNPYMELEVKELTEKVVRLLQGNTEPKPCGRVNCNCTR